ncbi:transcription elongation factor NusA [Thiohalorhabdus denitrificans]|uniref:Transcription termination/antitermination protein NusA n=1 Tax=Thiohalorhabdus denitrificans TaxID=381306 RepID=A0A0P9CUN9_9GAMM|nr:transcription termination factor NusA [Thiohalorhabdus denitrificans]KPV40386.1 transcription elongation factor NusA [Thiohalorhabdus denitrificans]SCY59237.1 NusA antitermination factor [Thiohalorhabdus denitrificans]
MSSEILMVVDSVARQKGVDKDIIFQAMEAALTTVSKKKYGQDKAIRVEIDKDTGDFRSIRYWTVVPDDAELEEPEQEMHLSEARERDPEVEVGGTVEEDLPPIEFGRIAAQTAKQVILQKVREAERDMVVEEYEDRVGELITGVIKRMERGNAIIDLNRTEAILPRNEQIPRENLRAGDRVRAYLYDVRRTQSGPQVFLSRTHPQLIVRLFELEVPEIAEGIIQIRGAARDPGSRAKIAVSTSDDRIDPVGACVGLRGSRVQKVVDELAGERVDIIQHTGDPATFVCNALSPAEISRVVVDEELHTIDVVVNEDQLSLAIGRGGQNVRLASQLTGWEIDILTEEEEREKRNKEFEVYQKLFMEQLEADEEVAGILAEEGFSSLEEIAYVPLSELASVEEFDEEVAQELRTRARDALLNKAIAEEERLESEMDPSLMEVEGMDEATARRLVSGGVKSQEDLADSAVDELLDIDGITEQQAHDLIMAARRPWFEGGEQASGQAES